VRALFAVALCLVLGGCATFGGGEVVDPYGIYDAVSFNGEPLPRARLTGGWVELRADSTGTVRWFYSEVAEPFELAFSFALGEMEAGCISVMSSTEGFAEEVGSICGDVYTVESQKDTVVLHKRR
jgi:hypothetical protein